MEIAGAKEFLKNKHHSVLVTRKKDSSLQMTLVSPVIGTDGNLIITSRATTYNVKNIKHNPRISLLVFGEQFHGSKYIQIDGKAESFPSPRLWISLSTGTRKSGESLRTGMRSEKRRKPSAGSRCELRSKRSPAKPRLNLLRTD